MRFRLRFLQSVLLLNGCLTGSLVAQQQRPGQVNDRFAQLCASCHGAQMQGGQAPSLLDDVWAHGGDDESIARSIHDGYPEKGMPAWRDKFTDQEIRAMVIYIREQRSVFQRGQMKFPKPAESLTVESEQEAYQLNTWAKGVEEPWAMSFLPDGNAVVTEKRGNLVLIDAATRQLTRIKNVPRVDSSSQAGMFQVLPHPRYAENGWLYLAYSHPQKNAAGNEVSLTRIVRGKLKNGEWVEQQTIFQAPLEMYPPAGGVHFGGRIVIDKKGYLFFTIGERGRGENAQDLSVVMGKVHRVFDDGRVPEDNPFVNQPPAAPTIWSYGHRNPQGLAIDPSTGDLYDSEHGPRGGDELNCIKRGLNYGWPVITYGMNYDGTPMTNLTAKEGMEQPVAYWVPSLAVSGITFYTGDLFPKWKNQLFLASLAAEELRRLELKDGQVVHQEILFKGLGRIRSVVTGPDGALYVLLPKRIARIAPAEKKE